MMLTTQPAILMLLDRAGGIYVLEMSISATMYYSIREKAKTKMAAAGTFCYWPVTILFFIKLCDKPRIIYSYSVAIYYVKSS